MEERAEVNKLSSRLCTYLVILSLASLDIISALVYRLNCNLAGVRSSLKYCFEKSRLVAIFCIGKWKLFLFCCQFELHMFTAAVSTRNVYVNQTKLLVF